MPARQTRTTDGECIPGPTDIVRDTAVVRDTDTAPDNGKRGTGTIWRYSPEVPSVFLQSWGPLLVVLHSLSAIVLCGASVHQALLAVLLVQQRPVRSRSLRLYGWTTLLAYLSTLTAGALLYPRYRVVIRALFLDRHAPWAANLFDFKENLATIGLPLAIGALLIAQPLSTIDLSMLKTNGDVLHRTSTEAASESSLRVVIWMYVVMTVGTALVCLTNVVAGLLCTAVRGA